MITNQASQSIGAQMLDTAGAAYTGTVTVYITIDAGTQAIGTVGAGVCTSEGNGYYTYRPSQVETNGSLVAFTFIGTGAIPVTIQVVTISAAQSVSVAAAVTSTLVGQDLLNMMELLNQELQLQPGETDVTRGLIALNIAQDYFENLAAIRKVKTGDTVPTVEIASVANTETTAFPVGFIRIDRIQRLSGTGGSVVAELTPLERTGGHAHSITVPWLFTASGASGTPYGYWTQGTSIYWSPKPVSAQYFRVYGFKRAANVAAAGAFAYDDGVAFPVASFAARILSIGVADSTTDITTLASETFKSILDTLEQFRRDGGQNLTYSRVHTE